MNASHNDFRKGVDDLIKAEAVFLGRLTQLVTRPLAGRENYDEMIRQLTENRDAMKVYVEAAGNGARK